MSKSSININELEDFIAQHYDLRFNIATCRIEFKSISQGDNIPFSVLQERDENSILMQLLRNNIKVSKTILRNLLSSDFVKRFDPFLHYLEHLPKWDGIDYINRLAETVKTSNPSYWKMCLSRWMVAMVGSLVDEETTNHTVLVLSGGQGLGKTTWIQNLIPPQLNQFVYSGSLRLNNNDTTIQLSECALINLDELENMNPRQVGAVKEIITKKHIRLRRAFGRNNENYIRRASFTASVNDENFLCDTTGNRRFLSFKVLEIDYSSPINYSQLYSQALHLYKSKFKHWFDNDEISDINKNNEQFERISVLAESLLSMFEPVEDPDNNEHIQFLTTTELVEHLKNKPATDTDVQRLGKELKKHKFNRFKKDGLYKYAVQRKYHLNTEAE